MPPASPPPKKFNPPAAVSFAEMVKTNNGPRKAKNPPPELVAFDPGTVTAGLARFRHGDLVSGMPIQPRGRNTEERLVDLGRRCRLQVQSWALRGPVLVVVERPIIVDGWTKDPSAVVWIAGAMGAFLSAIPAGIDVRVLSRAASDWKGQKSKKGMNDAVVNALFQAEKDRLPIRPVAKDFDNNMLDAIGIGLHHLHRVRGA